MAKKKLSKIAEEIKSATVAPPEEIEMQNKGNFDLIVSSGSTVLDLAISGGRVRGGGIPAGLVFEIFGPSMSGKTAVLAEIATSTQGKKGEVMFLDPEARLDREYAEIYGLELNKNNYYRPDTVVEMFEKIQQWEPANYDIINVVAADSLAALSTEIEMESEDKRGQKRAKDFSSGLRKTCRLIAKNNLLIACSNQERTGDLGTPVTPGGKGIPFYASIRIRIKPTPVGHKIEKSKTVYKTTIKKVVGIQCECEVKKTVDDPFRKAKIFIMFGVGIDDVRGNLTYIKEMTGTTNYIAVDKEFARIEPAITYIEENNYEAQLRENTIDLWEELERAFKVKRKPKVRF